MTSSLSLQDVRVPACNLLPKTDGLKSPLMCLNQARYGIAWGGVGAAMACYDCALQYARLPQAVPRSAHRLPPTGAGKAGLDDHRDHQGAACSSLQVGRLKDQDNAGFQHISMAKRNNVWMALECARMARDILGANGIADEYPGLPPHVQPGIGEDLRRHARHPHADHGQQHDGD